MFFKYLWQAWQALFISTAWSLEGCGGRVLRAGPQVRGLGGPRGTVSTSPSLLEPHPFHCPPSQPPSPALNSGSTDRSHQHSRASLNATDKTPQPLLHLFLWTPTSSSSLTVFLLFPKLFQRTLPTSFIHLPVLAFKKSFGDMKSTQNLLEQHRPKEGSVIMGKFSICIVQNGSSEPHLPVEPLKRGRCDWAIYWK